MQNQTYNIVPYEDQIKILKNNTEIYCILLANKSINLKDLYDKMQINIDDVYYFANGLKKIDEPKSDSDRIFNNTFDFLNSLLVALNIKLKELSERRENSIFS